MVLQCTQGNTMGLQ